MSPAVVQQIISSTPLLGSVDRVEYLDKGYSTEKKYVLRESGIPKFLLRLSDISNLESRQKTFDLIRQHYERGSLCPRPYHTGVTGDGGMCYTILGYISGRSAEEAVPELSKEHQYEMGVSAGKELYKLHQLSCPDKAFDWPGHRREKYFRRLNEFNELGFTFTSRDKLEKHVETNLDLLDNAEVRFQHDDYHLANLIVEDGKLAGVIDFNNMDWGDPVEDFCRVPWFVAPVSEHFARGQVDGYLSEYSSNDFWRRYNLYVAMQMHGTLVWVNARYPEQLAMFRDRLENILVTHDFENSGPPAWYTKSS
jgi:aminoglycoside phosphotransferase (APT) family kinase protein